MREITEHKVNGLNEHLQIEAVDAPGDGGANHSYVIRLIGGYANVDRSAYNLQFQKGPIQEVGVNGVSNEALLAIVGDRLRSFQAGAFSCRENAIALTNVDQALMWLHKRTRGRVARGVEGTHQK